MSNSYFQFKRFIVNQESCAMKVSTEACILGAWANAHDPQKILDIGAGTGLLSLMTVQNHLCSVDAVELEPNAALQAKENFLNSPWKDSLHLIQSSIQDYSKGCQTKYDLIISNPPFYKNSLKSENESTNQARHDASLSKDDLIEAIKKLRSNSGIAYILLPEREAEEIKILATEANLQNKDSLIIKNRIETPIFRKIIALGDIENLDTEELVIRYDNGNYTELFKHLMQPFYLDL